MKNINNQRFVIIALAIVFALTAVSQVAFTQQLDKNVEKKLTKQAKEQAKKLEKDGWEVFGSSKSLEQALFEHYSRIETGKTREIVVTSTCRSINVCKKNAKFNAQTDYAQEISNDIMGIASDVVSNDVASGLDGDTFTGEFTGKIKADLSGILSESLSLIREKDGKNEYRAFFIINKEKEGAARASALEAALKETKLTLEQSALVTKFIEDKFKEKDEAKSQMSESEE